MALVRPTYSPAMARAIRGPLNGLFEFSLFIKHYGGPFFLSLSLKGREGYGHGYERPFFHPFSHTFQNFSSYYLSLHLTRFSS